MSLDIKRLVNAEGVMDHIALLPTKSRTSVNFEKLDLTENEEKILELIYRNLEEATSEPYTYEKTTVIISYAGELFTATGIRNLELGWKKNRPDETKEHLLPKFQIGEKVVIDSVFTERRQIDPPEHYTEGKLLQAMEKAGKNSPEHGETHSGIGTPATRADIIEKLIKRGFIERVGKGNQPKRIVPTEMAYLLDSVLSDSLKSADLTAEWEAKLSEVEKGTLDPNEFLEQIKKYIIKTLSDADE